ncbi:MAG: hypothetical protein KDH09_19645, partial [Chrysiogenetes bacterium]|nr:hypothetical protein [Chrysiogenetes bacterium]
MIPGDAEQSARVFAGAREMVDIWACFAGARLARPKCAALRALALASATRQFSQCDLSRASLSAAALYLRHETKDKKLFAEGKGEQSSLANVVGPGGEALLSVLREPCKSEPAEEFLTNAALGFLDEWERASTRESWPEICAQMTSALVKDEPNDARSRYTMRALANCVLTLLRSPDQALRVQAAHTILRTLAGSIAALPDDDGGGAPKFTIGGPLAGPCMGGGDGGSGDDATFPAPPSGELSPKATEGVVQSARSSLQRGGTGTPS